MNEMRLNLLRTTFHLALVPALAAPALAGEGPDFNREIRPILSEHCFACHGPDKKARKADLRLDTQDGSRRDLDGYHAIVPGMPEDSELIFRIETEDKEEVMPPPKHGDRLSAKQIALLKAWITSGAKYQQHWSFVAPKKAKLPVVSEPDWAQSPIDRFVLAKLDQNELEPSAPTDRLRLIRRLSLDLTGLPPTPEEADAFVRDQNPDAYQKVVARLLASEAYGEHWARMWLDLARYADTKGYERDKPRNIWRYRDWVIEAFNRDMPYDQFTVEQLAGDLLPGAGSDELLATAFHRNTMTNEEGGTDDEEFRVAAVKDRTDTTMQVWMGLTAGCAKCHTHKYDPISIEEYYRLYAFFNQTQDNDREEPFRPVPTREQQQKVAQLRVEIADSRQPKTKQAELAKLEASFPKVPVMLDLPDGKQRITRLQKRGNFLDPGVEVSPATIALFGSFPKNAPANRLGLARWVMQAENPLTARVMVNRIWARIFGIGLVETEENFGSQGFQPSHPELLDWLAVDFREQGWSIKQLIRSLVLSNTYQQRSNLTPEMIAKDPRNRLLARGPRFRLSAEMVRDQALASSGLLTRRIGGPSVMPPQPAGVWRTVYSGNQWRNATGPDRYRRGLYTYLKRTSPYPAMTTFDSGSGEICLVRRIRTNTPLQALVTLNDPAFLEAAGALAKQMSEHKGGLDQQVTRGFRLCLTRLPSARELSRLTALHQSLRADYESDPEAAKQLLASAGLKEGDAAMIGVANVLLNLDETLTKP
jgi:mono/diheme cytochrome c family protein